MLRACPTACQLYYIALTNLYPRVLYHHGAYKEGDQYPRSTQLILQPPYYPVHHINMSLGKKNPVVLLTVRPSPPFPSDPCTNPFWYSDARPALQNDDGPPSPSSPNIYSFALALRNKLNWDVRVVIPDCQKSWVGSAYAISDVVQAMFFYPRGPDGLTGDIEYKRRPLNKEQGEEMEWVLLTGTPATCANIALHNIYEGEIDLVVSGPNREFPLRVSRMFDCRRAL